MDKVEQPGSVGVTQADREAYVAYLLCQPGVDPGAQLFARIRAGREDDKHGPRLAAFLRRRLTADGIAGAFVPAGMVLWTGGDSAPEDWDGGPVLLRSGAEQPSPPTVYCWGHGWLESGMGDIIAYTPRAAAIRSRPAPNGERV